MSNVDLNALTRALYSRGYTLIVVPLEKRTISSGPRRSTSATSITTAGAPKIPAISVYGWLVFDFDTTSEGMLPVCRFTAHAVLEDPTGRLFDITPSRSSQRYPLLWHEGSEEEFAVIIAAGYTTSIFTCGD
jgi:hypothetical protein